MTGLDLNRRAIELDQSQPGGPPNSSYIPPFAPYQRQHVTSSLIRRGQSRYSSIYGNLARIHARYGVDPGVLMAIYGHETSYGAVTGGFDLLEALASLAYEGRRRAMFESEFISALRLIDMGVPRWRLKGSYAGATGYPQFMPSVVVKLRADGDGDGYADIWGSESDGLASIANYLRNAGWKPGVPWGVAVRVSPTLNRAAIRSTLRAPRCERVYSRHSRWLTVGQWRAHRRCAVQLFAFGPGSGHFAGAGRSQQHGIPADRQLPGDPRLQLLQFLRALGRPSGKCDREALNPLARVESRR